MPMTTPAERLSAIRTGGRPLWPAAPPGARPPVRSTIRPSSLRSPTRLETVLRDNPVRRAISARLAMPSPRSVCTTRPRLSSRSDPSDPEVPFLLMASDVPRSPARFVGTADESTSFGRPISTDFDGKGCTRPGYRCRMEPSGTLDAPSAPDRTAPPPPDPRAVAAPVPLLVLVFTGGAASLGAEIAAARLLAPDFGASTVIWANTIGVVLVALSAGYWLGGRAADRHPNERALRVTVLAAAVLLAVVP